MRYCLFVALLFVGIPVWGQMHHYYGNLHAHTAYSDGNQDHAAAGATPGQSFAFAKQSYHFDFLGISEHNHYQAGMQNKSYYHAGLFQADTANANGTFVALYGMEWGVITNGGHVLIYGSNDLIGWDTVASVPDFDTYCPKYDYDSLWRILHRQPSIVAFLAHPSNSDYSSLVTTTHNALYDSVIVGSAVRSGNAFSTTTTYSDAPATLYESYFRNALARGYRVAPTIDHDNHNTTFGRTAETRTVIIASALHRDTLLKALREMHFYASDDWNAELTFTVNGNMMGAELGTTGATVSVQVAVTDVDPSDPVAQIQLYSGIAGSGTNATVLTSNVNQSALNYSANVTLAQTRYYYAKVTQADGDIIWSAPIWVTRNAALGVNLLSFQAHRAQVGNELRWAVAQEVNMSGYRVQRSPDGLHFEDIGVVASLNERRQNYSFTDEYPTGEVAYYRLAMEATNGDVDYSGIVGVRQEYAAFKFRGLYPNPASNMVYLAYTAAANQDVTLNIYDLGGQKVLSTQATLTAGSNELIIDITSLPKGLYYLTLSTANYRLVDTHLLKA